MSSASAREARRSLDTVAHAEELVAAEIGPPRWYWAGLALGWVAVTACADAGPGWLAVAAYLACGVVHAAVSSRVLTGQRYTRRLRVRAGVAGVAGWPHAAGMIGFLLLLVVATLAVALALHTTGVGHPTLLAGAAAGVVIVVAGPRVPRLVGSYVRGRADRAARAR